MRKKNIIIAVCGLLVCICFTYIHEWKDQGKMQVEKETQIPRLISSNTFETHNNPERTFKESEITLPEIDAVFEEVESISSSLDSIENKSDIGDSSDDANLADPESSPITEMDNTSDNTDVYELPGL